MDESIKSMPAYWEMIVNLHNEGYKNIEYPKDVAERNIEFLNKLKLDNTKTQVIQTTSKGHLIAHMNDNNELVPFDVDIPYPRLRDELRKNSPWKELMDLPEGTEITLK